MKRLVVAAVMLAVVGLSFAKFAVGQSAVATTTTVKPPAAANSAGTTTAADAERSQIWDSPQMLRARAWLKDHDAHSARVTPEEAKEHETELANLSPKQMKLWLLKFQHEEEVNQQQRAMFNSQRQAEVHQAMAMHEQIKQSYKNINADANQAAQTAEDSIKQQQEFAQQDGLQKSADRGAAVTDMLTQPFFGGYGSYGGYGVGGVHYHFH